MPEAYIELELSAASPYVDFVYGDQAIARAVDLALLATGKSEFADAYGVLALDAAGAPIGMFAGPLDAKELGKARLNAAQVLMKQPALAADPEIRSRAASSRPAFFVPQEGDAYLSRIAVADRARGAGAGKALLKAFLERSRERGLRRAVLEVSTQHQAAMHMYESAGFSELATGEAKDEKTGRALVYRHMALAL